MAVKTLYVLNSVAVTPGWFGQLQDGGTAPSAVATSYGWVVGTTAVTTPYWRARLGAAARATAASASSNIDSASGPVKGTGTTITTAGDSFITPTTYAGSLAAGTWTFAWVMRTAAITTTGRLRMRVWASVNADGSGARELTSGAQVGATVTMNAANTNFNSSISWSAPAITLVNEYLFFQVEWQETVAGTISTATAHFWVSAATITTTNFIVSAIGSLATTEAVDTPALSGTVAWLGTLAAVESSEITADSELYTADNDVLTIDTIPQAKDSAVFTGAVSAGAVTGTLAATESADTAAFAGLVGRSGTLAATEGADATGFTGTAVTLGTLAATEGSDVAAFAGLVGRSGTLATVEAGDTAVFTATVRWLGVLAATEGVADTAAFTGTVATPAITGVLAAIEGAAVAAFTGTVRWLAVLAATEGADVFAFSGNVANIRIGTLDAYEDSSLRADSTVYTADSTVLRVNSVVSGDVANFVGQLAALGALAATEANDASGFAGEVFYGVTRIGALEAYEDRFSAGLWPTADSTVYTVDLAVLTADVTLFAGDAAHFTGAVNVVVLAALDAFEDKPITADSTLITADSSITVDTVGAIGDIAQFTATVPLVTGVLAAREDVDGARFSDEYFAVLAAQEDASDVASFFYMVPDWEGIRADIALRNEVQRMVWLVGLGERVLWLESEVEDVSELENLNPEVISLANEVERIGTLRP